MTHVAIVGGTGAAGRGLGLRLARAGVPVRIGSRDALEAAMDVVRLLPGVRPIALGGLEMARVIERMTLLTVAVNVQYRMLTTRFRVVGSDRLDRPPLGPKHG